MREAGRLPRSLTAAWIACAPLATAFAARIVWEKTALRGQRNTGWAMVHIHPTFFIGGVSSWLLLAVWFVTVAILVARGRILRLTFFEKVMLGISFLFAVALFLP